MQQKSVSPSITFLSDALRPSVIVHTTSPIADTREEWVAGKYDVPGYASATNGAKTLGTQVHREMVVVGNVESLGVTQHSSRI